MKIAIIYYRLLSEDGNRQLVGGIETYLIALAELFVEIGAQPTLFQISSIPFKKSIGGLKVVGIKGDGLPVAKQKMILYNAAISSINPLTDILIFGADHCSVRTKYPRAISIQHGVSWDLPSKYVTKKNYLKSGIGALVKKWSISRMAVKDFENCMARVCVDYNFLNWYRTQIGGEIKGKVWVIPNFADHIDWFGINTLRNVDDEMINIIYARRFTEYRGAKLMVLVVKDLLNFNSNISFTFAGEGPEEIWMRNQFINENRVRFIKYEPCNSIEIHAQHHIAVVPSIASEGTSFSVAEAMAAGCAVVATNIGGMTNMIIDGYNGFLVMPSKDSLLEAIQRLILNEKLRNKIGERAKETVKNSFNLDNWKENWLKVLEYVSK